MYPGAFRLVDRGETAAIGQIQRLTGRLARVGSQALGRGCGCCAGVGRAGYSPRHMQGRVLAWGVALLLAGSWLIAGCGDSEHGGRALHSLSWSLAAGQIPPKPADSRRADPWSAYWTQVDPGSSIGFGSERFGVALVTETFNQIDGQLETEPYGPGWPGPGVLESSDGGRSWGHRFSVYGGFWGLDVLDGSRAWAVGVSNGLYRTSNGGVRWQRVGEPSSPLVRVAFTDALNGFGLTVAGAVVRSHDGGSSWRPSGFRRAEDAVCAGSAGVAMVADDESGVWRTTNGGSTWRLVAPDIQHVEEFSNWWPELSCKRSNMVELARAYCEAACGGAVLAEVRQSTDGGVHWRRVLTQTAGSYPLPRDPRWSPNFQLVRVTPMGEDGFCAAGYAQPLAVSCTQNGGRSYTPALALSAPFPGSGCDPALLGSDSLSPTKGWVLGAACTTISKADTYQLQGRVWSTSDSGHTWSIAWTGASRPIKRRS